MAKNISVIQIKAPLEKVWAALTEPALVKQWQYGCDLITNWQPGSEIRFVAEWEGQVFEQWGKVLEFHPCEKIKYSLFAPRPGLEDRPENYFIMEYRLSANEGVVTIEIIQEDERPGAVQEEPAGEENPVLKGLKMLIEE